MAGPPGWYGKLAMLGDFAQRRLPDEVVRPLDRWLAATMLALPPLLGPRWPSAYLQAPVLRFACAPGVLGGCWWFGTWMPSCDRVGRYYPLWLAQAAAGAPCDADGLLRLARWYDAVTAASLQTLDDGATVDAFEASLTAVAGWDQAHRAAIPAGQPPAVPADLPDSEGGAVWWASGAGPMALRCTGWPDAPGLIRLFTTASEAGASN